MVLAAHPRVFPNGAMATKVFFFKNPPEKEKPSKSGFEAGKKLVFCSFFGDFEVYFPFLGIPAEIRKA